MSQFRKMVEDTVQQIMHQPEPTVLTDDIKAQVLDAVNKMEPDITELGSYVHHNTVHIGEPPFGPDDDDEYERVADIIEDEFFSEIDIDKSTEDK